MLHSDLRLLTFWLVLAFFRDFSNFQFLGPKPSCPGTSRDVLGPFSKYEWAYCQEFGHADSCFLRMKSSINKAIQWWPCLNLWVKVITVLLHCGIRSNIYVWIFSCYFFIPRIKKRSSLVFFCIWCIFIWSLVFFEIFLWRCTSENIIFITICISTLPYKFYKKGKMDAMTVNPKV